MKSPLILWHGRVLYLLGEDSPKYITSISEASSASNETKHQPLAPRQVLGVGIVLVSLILADPLYKRSYTLHFFQGREFSFSSCFFTH